MSGKGRILLQSCKDDVNNYFVFSCVGVMMMVMMVEVTMNLVVVPLPRIIVATSVPSLGSLPPVLAVQVDLS